MNKSSTLTLIFIEENLCQWAEDLSICLVGLLIDTLKDGYCSVGVKKEQEKTRARGHIWVSNRGSLPEDIFSDFSYYSPTASLGISLSHQTQKYLHSFSPYFLQRSVNT